MSKLVDKFRDFMGIGSEEEDEEDSYYEDEEPVRRGASEKNSRRDRDSRSDRYDDRYEAYDRYDKSDRYEEKERAPKSERASSGRASAYEDIPARSTYTPNSARRTSEKSASPAQDTYPLANGMKMIVYHPVTYEDTQHICDNVKNRKPVIVNMEDLEVDCAQRILDFLSGAIYALNGTMSKISRGIFIVAPTNCAVVGNDDDGDEYDA